MHCAKASNLQIFGSSVVNIYVTWTPTEIASKKQFDFSGDGFPDLLYHNSATTAIGVMTVTKGAVRRQQIMMERADPDWRVVSTQDFDQDGKADVAVANTIFDGALSFPASESSFSSSRNIITEQDSVRTNCPSWNKCLYFYRTFVRVLTCSG